MTRPVLIDERGYPPADVAQLNLRGLQAEIEQRASEMGAIAALPDPTPADEELFTALEDRWRELTDARQRIASQRQPNVRDYVNSGQARREVGAFDPGRDRVTTGGGYGHRDAALRRVDARRDLGDDVRNLMVESVDAARGPERDRLSRWIATSADADYEAAVMRWLHDPDTGPQTWSDAERAAVRRVQDEARALSLTDASGGYLVGATVDFATMLTGATSVDPMRRVSRNVTTTTDQWAGITSAGTVASWDAEAAEVSDDSPTFASPNIPVHKGQSFIPVSWEVDMDAGIGSALGPMFAEARDELEANSHTLGTGVGQPRGVITALTAAPGSSVKTSAATSATLADATALQNGLGARWRPNARFMANLTILNQYRQQVAGTGLTVPALSGGQMLGWPVEENSQMDGVITGSATHDYVLLCGDFGRGYIVVDRIGMAVVKIPALFGPSGRPTSQVGYLMRWRSGGDVPAGLEQAFQLLDLSA